MTHDAFSRRAQVYAFEKCIHPGVELRANLKSIFHRCYLREAAFERELTNETIYLPLGCLQGGRDRQDEQVTAPCGDLSRPSTRERICIERMTWDCKVKVSREGLK